MDITKITPCRWRGSEITEGRYTCSSTKLQVSPQGVTPATCAFCYCRDHEPVLLENISKPRKNVVIQKTPCIHLREPTGETQECPSCTGKVLVKIFHCSIYNECTIYKEIKGKACCNNCKDYKSKEGI